MIKKSKIAFFLSLLIFSLNSLTYSQSDLENLFDLLQKSDHSTQKDVLEKIILSISDIDPNISQQQTERMLKLTVKFNDQYCYNRALLFYARFGSVDEKKNKLKASIQLANDRGDLELMARSLISLSEVYQDDLKYDSSIASILKARDLFRITKNKNEEVTVLHKLGDMYFIAGSLDKAEIYYKKVLRLKGDTKAWFDWRKFVITNNFGLIERERKNYNKAIEYFEKALNDLLSEKQYVLNYSDTVRMVYSYTSAISKK